MNDFHYIQNITEENFNALVIEASRKAPVLVDFWAPWCGPCRSLTPILERLAREYAGKFTLAKINTDEEQMLASRLGIRSLPTVKIVRDGRIVDEFVGAQPEQIIRQLLDRHVTTKPSEKLRAQAREALASGAPARAAALLQQAAAAAPDDDEIKLELAGALLRTGAAEDAEEILHKLPAALQQSPEAKALVSRLQFARAMGETPDVDHLVRRVAASPDDLKARYQLGANKLLTGDYEAGLEQFFEIMQRDRKFEDDLGRKSLLAAFEIIDKPELVNRYRQRMSAMLF